MFKDTVSWISGASSGIGEALACALAGEGAIPVLSARREEELERVRARCLELGAPDALVLPLDVTDETAMPPAVATVLERFGRIDTLINNAGISQRSLCVDTDMAVYRRLFEVEVSEIADGTVEIKGIAREPGYRTKIAVVSHDEKVDPVGACVGMRGIRVKNIVRELNNEKVDIIRWDADIRAGHDLVVIAHGDDDTILDGVSHLARTIDTGSVRMKGVILNKLGGYRHEDKLRKVIEHYTDIHVIGAVHNNPALDIEERHLGLVPSHEDLSCMSKIDALKHAVQEQVDLDALLQGGGHLGGREGRGAPNRSGAPTRREPGGGCRGPGSIQ